MNRYRVTVENVNTRDPDHHKSVTEIIEARHPGDAQIELLRHCFKKLGWRKAVAYVPTQLDV